MIHVTPLVAVLGAGLTWTGFAGPMRYYFRGSAQRTPAKTWLMVSALACTLAQLGAMACFKAHSQPHAWVGIACLVAANLVFWWSLSAHGKSHPAFACLPAAPVSCTTTGPYRMVRHPIYTAYLLAWMAGPLITGQFWLILPVGWMWWLYYRAARQEEQHFSGTAFAGQYRDYQRQTGMFFPRVFV